MNAKPGRTASRGLILCTAAAIAWFCAGCGGEAADGPGFPVYYLYPGEPAPVEGPQMERRDFEEMLKRFEDARSKSLSE